MDQMNVTIKKMAEYSTAGESANFTRRVDSVVGIEACPLSCLIPMDL